MVGFQLAVRVCSEPERLLSSPLFSPAETPSGEKPGRAGSPHAAAARVVPTKNAGTPHAAAPPTSSAPLCIPRSFPGDATFDLAETVPTR